MEQNRIYPSLKNLIKPISIFSVILLVLLYSLFSSRFAWAYTEGDVTGYIVQDVCIIAIWLVLTILSMLVLLKQSYYLLNNKEIIHHKLNQEISYSFSSILYIDEEYTKKTNTLLFYLNTGRSVFLVLDKDKEIYKAVTKGAKNLISKEEFHIKFPKVKL